MKLFFTSLLLIALLISCKKDDAVTPEINSISEDLQLVIKNKGVQALQVCNVGLSCTQTIGWGTDYSFEGDNIVRLRDRYYNLNKMDYYEIETIGTGTTEIRMTLFFPQ